MALSLSFPTKKATRLQMRQLPGLLLKTSLQQPLQPAVHLLRVLRRPQVAARPLRAPMGRLLEARLMFCSRLLPCLEQWRAWQNSLCDSIYPLIESLHLEFSLFVARSTY